MDGKPKQTIDQNNSFNLDTLESETEYAEWSES